VADPDDVVTVERVIPAPPEEIFELLADPRRHRMIDGSDSVRDPKNAPPRLSLGAKIDMAMKLGIPYTMTNEVLEFEEGRRIAWQPRRAARLARSFGGRIWRYELDPVPGGTRRARDLGHLPGAVGVRLGWAARSRRTGLQVHGQARARPRSDGGHARADRARVVTQP
jgi:hypothetical protein